MKNRAAYNQIQAYENSKQKSEYQQLPTLNRTDLVPQILSKVNRVTCSDLRIQDRPYPNLIKEICHISFPSLTYLNLRNSQICNIEALEFLQCPLLITLQLYGNKIINLNPITKNSGMKGLRTLTIYRNPLKSPWKLQRQNMYRHSEFQLDDSSGSPCSIEDLSFLFKVPSKKITKIYAYSNERIKQNRLLELIKIINSSY